MDKQLTDVQLMASTSCARPLMLSDMIVDDPWVGEGWG